MHAAIIFAASAIVYLGYFLALTLGGNFFCRAILKSNGLENPGIIASKAGRIIGALERSLIAIGIFSQSWEIIIAIIALKTVARYQELDKQSEAEYFLVGSLASLLWAVALSIVFMAFDRHWGWNIAGMIARAAGAD